MIADDGKCPPEAFAGEMAYLKEKVVAGICKQEAWLLLRSLRVSFSLSPPPQTPRDRSACTVVGGPVGSRIYDATLR